MQQIHKLITALDAVTSLDDDKQLTALDEAIQQIAETENPELSIPALLRIFERFPEDDGYGIIWGIVHLLEGLPEYEPQLLMSLQRQPSQFGVLMVNRLLNAGCAHVGDIILMDALYEILLNPLTPTSVRDDTIDFLKHQNQ